MKVTARNIFLFVYMFLIIALSNTVFFGLAHRTIVLYVAIVVVAMSFLLRHPRLYRAKKRQAYNIVLLLLLSLLTLFSFSMTGEMQNSAIRNTYIGYIVCYFLAYQSTNIFDKRTIRKTYTTIMLVYAVISLFFFVIAVFLPSVARAMPMAMTQQGYYYNIFYTWGWQNYGSGVHIFSRNSGPFWEPGAFQGFLVLAILMLLQSTKEAMPYKRTDHVLLIFLITLVTTQSTTGLILLVVICIFWREDLKRILISQSTKKVGSRKIKIVVAGLVVMAGLLWLVSSNTISDKLADYTDSATSTSIRMGDMLNSISLMFVRPLAGLGVGTKLIAHYEAAKGIVNNSNGLFLMLYAMGLLFGIFYLWAGIRGFLRFFEEKDKLKKIVLVGIYLVIQATETVFIFPMYLLFLYWFLNDRRKQKQK